MTEKVLIYLWADSAERGSPFDRSGRDSLLALEHVDSILAVWPGDLGLKKIDALRIPVAH